MPELKSVAGSSTSIQPTRKKKKGPKGPNPLSVKKKKPKDRPQPGKAPASEKISAGSKRKFEQVVVNAVRIHDDDTIEKHKRRKKSDSDSHCVVDAINNFQ